jgi:hypothetical protein
MYNKYNDEWRKKDEKSNKYNPYKLNKAQTKRLEEGFLATIQDEKEMEEDWIEDNN